MTAVLVISSLLVVCAAALVLIRPLLTSILLLSAYSGLAVVLLCLLGAVDVAFTEAVVGAGISTVLLMTFLGRIDVAAIGQPSKRSRLIAAAGTIMLGVSLTPAILALPRYGDPNAPAAIHVAPEYLRRAVAETHTRNVVTAVLADYRGFDTLIETTVIMTAAVACVLILRRRA